MTTSSSDLDLARRQMIAEATANPQVADAMAAFNAASSYIPSPTQANFAPVHYSTSGTTF